MTIDFDNLRRHVKRRLMDSGVIPEQECNPENPESIATRIVHNSSRQGSHALKYAEFYIEQAIKFPPEYITSKRFSLSHWTAEMKPAP